MRIETPLREFWTAYRANTAGMFGLVLLSLLFLLALFAPSIAPYDPTTQFSDALLLPPIWAEGGRSTFILGTDDLGRDLLSRLLHGARLSISISLMVVTLSVFVGLLLGAWAGMCRGTIETVILRAMDMILALPSLLLAIVIIAVLGPSLTNAVIAVAIVFLPHFVRITRATLLTELSQEYVLAAKLDGQNALRLLNRTLLPNIAAPLIVQATLSFSNAILDIAALGFLGLGAQPPTPEWGTMLSHARQYIEDAPWVMTFPGLAILGTVLASNLMGDGLRDTLDPRLKR